MALWPPSLMERSRVPVNPVFQGRTDLTEAGRSHAQTLCALTVPPLPSGGAPPLVDPSAHGLEVDTFGWNPACDPGENLLRRSQSAARHTPVTQQRPERVFDLGRQHLIEILEARSTLRCAVLDESVERESEGLPIEHAEEEEENLRQLLFHAALFPLKGAGRDARDALRRLAELQFEPFEPAESVL